MQSCSSTTHGGPTTIADIKSYKPQSSSIGSGQVLQEPYPYEKAKLVVTEMADALALDLVVKGLVTNQIVITVGYDCDNENYDGEYSVDRYGRKIPKHARALYSSTMYSCFSRSSPHSSKSRAVSSSSQTEIAFSLPLCNIVVDNFFILKSSDFLILL